MIDIRFYWSLLMRRLPIMLALLIVCAVFGAVWAIRAPATYTASAQLLIEDPQIAQEASRNPDSAVQLLQVIEQRLMTRANLVDIANKLKVFPNNQELSVDAKLKAMENSTTVLYTSGRNEAMMMTTRFTSQSPEIAAGVVNEFTTLILSANSRSRVGRAEERLTFYQQEVDRLSGELDRKNARILEFKQANADALPENLRYRQDQQTFLQERATRLESDLVALQGQREEMTRLFEQTGGIGQTGTPQTPEQEQLAALQAELNNALGIYNENSPKVKSLRNRIEIIEQGIASRAAPVDGGQGGTGNPLLDLNLAQIDSRMASINEELTITRKEFDKLQESVNATASNAVTLGTLERDQANIQALYDAAVSGLGEAQTAERIEASARGQRITVVEGASVPTEPSGPNRTKIAAAGIGLGLGLAGGFFFLMELLNRTIRRPAELRSRFQITPLAVIPYIETRQERRRRNSYGTVMILAVLIIIPLGLWALHSNYMPLDILAPKIVSRLGLG